MYDINRVTTTGDSALTDGLLNDHGIIVQMDSFLMAWPFLHRKRQSGYLLACSSFVRVGG